MLQPGFIELIKKDIILGEVRPGKKKFNDYIFTPIQEDGTYDYRFKVPRYCISRKSGKTIDIKYNREGNKQKSYMNLGRSQNLLDCIEDLEDILPMGVTICREVIWFVEDIDYWRECLGECGVDLDLLVRKDRAGEWYKNYISWDILLPELGIVVELDSDYHIIQEVDDARDIYVSKKTGLKTYRWKDYHKTRDEAKESLTKFIRGNMKGAKPFIPNQVHLSLQYFLESHQKSLEVLQDLVWFSEVKPKDVMEMTQKSFHLRGINISTSELKDIHKIAGTLKSL